MKWYNDTASGSHVLNLLQSILDATYLLFFYLDHTVYPFSSSLMSKLMLARKFIVIEMLCYVNFLDYARNLGWVWDSSVIKKFPSDSIGDFSTNVFCCKKKEEPWEVHQLFTFDPWVEFFKTAKGWKLLK